MEGYRDDSDGIFAANPMISLGRFHIVLAVLGVSFLFLTFAMSFLYLVQDIGLKVKRPPRFLFHLPSLVACERIAHRTLIGGFALLTLGLLTGAVAAATQSQVRSAWEKEGLSLLSWGILAVILAARISRGWRGRKAAILTIIAFLVVLVRMLKVI